PLITPTATTANANTRRPYLPGTLSSITMSKSILNSAYHGLQITGEKRYSRNISLKGYYTFGKGLDVTNTQASTTGGATDWNNLALDRGRANNDRRHSFVLNGIWRLNYAGQMPGVVRAVAGGWSLSFISSMRSGRPLTMTAGNDRNLDGNSNDRANLVGDPRLESNRPRNELVDRFFNTTAFAQPADRNTGTAGRNIIDGPGLKNVDLGIFRDFRLHEQKRVQFRAEMSNAFNLVNLSNPGTGQNNSTNFGRITTAGPMRQVQLGLRLTF
ncbi:MAG: carboxypeptidase regulatory-like domain-containing protein, partial [Bryobacteraceae bacterium]